MIRAESFRKIYDTTVAVDGLSFTVARGEVLGLIGPNGAGKTTTLRAVAGISCASGGQLSVAGYDVEKQPIEAKQNLGYIPDDPQLFQDLTVTQHLAFIAAAYRVSDAKEKATALLEQFQLSPKSNAPVRDLSRGMRQKLAICCAYLRDPVAILFDEPLTGLDPHAIRTLKNSIIERSRAGAAVIISSHLLAMVDDFCTHLLVLDHGKARFFGSVDRLREEFSSERGDVSLEEIFFQATAPMLPADVT